MWMTLRIWKRKVMRLEDFVLLFLIRKIRPGCSKNILPLLTIGLSGPSSMSLSSVLYHLIPSYPLLCLITAVSFVMAEALSYSEHNMSLFSDWLWSQHDIVWPCIQIKSHVSTSQSFKVLHYSFQHLFPLYRLKPEKSETWDLLFKDLTNKQGHRGELWSELRSNTLLRVFAFFFLSDFTVYSVAKPGGVYGSKSTVGMQPQRKAWL